MVDTETSHDLQEYMLSRMRNLERARGKNTDNMMLNEYILKYPDKLFPLTSEWNYMPMLPDAPHLSKANFLHAVGINGKHVLTELVNQGLDFEILLQQLTEGFHIEFK